MLKKYKLPGAILLAGTAVLAILVIAKPTPQPAPADDEPAHVKVAVTPARKQAASLAVTAHGTVAPRREIDMVAQVSGQIVHVEPAFVDGGFFSDAQTLVKIDDRDYRNALLSAKARRAEAAQRLAEEEGRSRVAAREWRDAGNADANELFLRKPQLAAARANFAAAEGDVAQAELDLERTTIRAPFDGRIRQTYADLGQYVTAGSRVATVYDSTVVEVRIPLTEQQAALIDLPLTSAGITQAPPVTITGRVAGEVAQWEGVLARTDASVDAESRMYYAVVEVKDPFKSRDAGNQAGRAPLLPGLFVEAEIAGRQIDDVIVLPRAALFQHDKIATLDADNTVGYRSVNVLRKTDDRIWVKADLADNTLISLEKQSLTPQGTIVEPLTDQGNGPEVAQTTAPKTEKD